MLYDDVTVRKVKAAGKDQVEIIMLTFDFEKVYQVMNFLGWKWGGQIPTRAEIRQEARDMLIDARDNIPPNSSNACLGFLVEKDAKENLSLLFVLEDVNAGELV